ncbi:MAG: TetR/AcrR family transcriptional regulator [Candidatus Dormibacteraeota bacterium]|uniref:TetR/AcrR family transcriptional regulator n=1 Tax=Candidatus Amunia macphersoniae TaxID=3127014 RepID=A0A934KR52_9BACT|nr:TetR/AcrR family transcriptional regulator [Candidatus Dormibacteraeota bacterium]
MSTRPAARQTRRSARTRERIIEAATEVFARRGVHGTRVADIAERAGIAYGLVYHHFRNKEEILTAIFAERWAQYVAYLEELAGTPLSFRERMRRLIHFWVQTYRQESDLMTVMINEITRSYEFLESHDITAVLVAFDPIERIIAEGRENGEVRPGLDAKLATYVVLGVAEMVLTGYVIGSLPRTDPEQYAHDEEQLLAMLLEGMSAAPS